jgi:hypothetical protein
MRRRAAVPNAVTLGLVLLLLPAASPPPEDQRMVRGGRAGFVWDGVEGCWVWAGGIPAGLGPVTATWVGLCPDGPAEGKGRSEIRWREGERERTMVHEGWLRRGKAEGPGRLTHLEDGQVIAVEEGEFRDDFFLRGRLELRRGGAVYEGEWRRNQPHGPGRLTVRGEVLDGVWENGCLRVKDGWVAFTRPAEECEGRPT